MKERPTITKETWVSPETCRDADDSIQLEEFLNARHINWHTYHSQHSTYFRAWTPAELPKVRRELRRVWRGRDTTGKSLTWLLDLERTPQHKPTRLAWRAGTVQYRSNCPFRTVVWQLFQTSNSMHICPGCGMYFVAQYDEERFCDPECEHKYNHKHTPALNIQAFREAKVRTDAQHTITEVQAYLSQTTVAEKQSWFTSEPRTLTKTGHA